MRGITFIGMAGVGKSAVGKLVAAFLNWRFVDLDQMILETKGMSHHDYMKQHGEEALSELENQLALRLDLSDTVFSPPGSMIYAGQAMEKIKKDSVVVYLEAEPETVKQRLGDRLYQNGIIGLEEKGLAGVMAERIPLYEKYSDFKFISKGQSKDEMAKEVIAGLKLAGII